MSLVKSPKMTEKKVVANERNRKLSHPPVTDGRRERIGAALLRFGFNAQAEETAMRALGEDPAHFQELLEVLWEEWNPAGGSQEGVVIALGRALWLMNRAARMQEGYAVRQAQEASSGRDDRVHARIMRLKMTEERVRRLAEAVADEHYVTTRADLERMKNLHEEGTWKDMSETALALFYQLQPPGTGEDGIDPDEQSRRAVRRIKEIFGLTPEDAPPPIRMPGYGPPGVCPQDAPADVAPALSPAPAGLPANSGQVPVGTTPPAEKDPRYPNITAAEWEAREKPRQLLENLLWRQVEACEAQRKAARQESRKGPSPYERAAEIAPTHPNAQAMRRMQDSNLREVRRLTNLLLKLKRYEQQREIQEEKAASHDILETKEVSG
jgi:hypothetical protein